MCPAAPLQRGGALCVREEGEMAERVRVGVIGTGAIATLRHLPAFATSAAKGAAEIVAVADVDEASAHAAAERFGAEYVFTDYRELLCAPIDAVSICTPN